MFFAPWSRSRLKKQEPLIKTRDSSRKNMRLLYRLLEDEKYKEIVLYIVTLLYVKQSVIMV